MPHTHAGMNDARAFEALMDKSAVEIEAGLAVAIDDGKVGPVCDGRRKHEDTSKAIPTVLEDADAVGSDGKTAAGVVGRGIDLVARRRVEGIIAQKISVRPTDGAFERQRRVGGGIGPDGEGKGVSQTFVVVQSLLLEDVLSGGQERGAIAFHGGNPVPLHRLDVAKENKDRAAGIKVKGQADAAVLLVIGGDMFDAA